MENNTPKFSPGYYLLNNTAVIELEMEGASMYSVNLLYSSPKVRLPLASAGTVIDCKQFESIINTYGKEFIPVDRTKAEIVGMLYGTI